MERKQKKCAVVECESAQIKRGYCKKHFDAFLQPPVSSGADACSGAGSDSKQALPKPSFTVEQQNLLLSLAAELLKASDFSASHRSLLEGPRSSLFAPHRYCFRVFFFRVFVFWPGAVFRSFLVAAPAQPTVFLYLSPFCVVRTGLISSRDELVFRCIALANRGRDAPLFAFAPSVAGAPGAARLGEGARDTVDDALTECVIAYLEVSA